MPSAVVWRAGPEKWPWSSQDSTKCIKQSAVTRVSQEGSHSARALWFKTETTYIRADISGKVCAHLRYVHTWSE